MAEHTVLLRKRTGGCTIPGPDGKTYEWAEDGAAVRVPYDFALTLLGIPDSGFFVVDEGAGTSVDAGAGEGGAGQTPAPANSAKMAPDPAPTSITPRPRAATRTRATAKKG